MAQTTVFWEAFNDYRPTDGVTHVNATGYDLRATDDGGVLRNIATGADLPVSVIVVVEGDGVPDDFGANSPVNAGSPADLLFGGKVDIGNSGLPGIRNSTSTKLILNFTGLNPARRYKFRGTVSRGGNYNDRWSVYTLSGADSFADAHVDGSVNRNIFTKATFPASDLAPNQVALNSGENKVGSLVGWDNIEPGADGTFAVEAQQYVAVAPFGNPSAAAYGYGLNAMYLAEVASTGNLRITENPADQSVPAGATATFRVTATSPQAITYQWQKAGATGAFADIPGATQASYTTPALGVADHGNKYRCSVASGGAQAVSGEATLGVDGSIPSVTAVTGSVNFNALYVTFSEPMKLDQLADRTRFSVSGGLTVDSAVALDPVTARLNTSRQTAGAAYTVTVNNIQDLAGNSVPANTARSIAAFTVLPGVVGAEIWRDIGGGAVSDLRNNARYPAEPTVDYTISTLNSELVYASGPINTYGGRFRAWLTPEETGDYEFFIRAADQGELRVSLDDSFANLDNIDELPTASDTSADDTFQEPGLDESVSAVVSLVRGRRYALQAIWKESNGTDYCQIAWRKVGDPTPADQLQPIPSRLLSYYGPSAALPTPEITGVALQGGQVVVQWTGGTLQSSTDLQTWTDETGAAKPLSVAPTGTRKFYRVKQ